MRYDNISNRFGDNNETYCYVKIEPLYDSFIYKQDKESLWRCCCRGQYEVFINENTDLEVKNLCLTLIDTHNGNKNLVFYLYNGRLYPGGIVREWSKKPIRTEQTKMEKYRELQKQIDELRLQQRDLLKN